MPELAAPTNDPSQPGPAAPARGSEAPLQALAACHDRIEALCDSLLHLVAHLARQGADLHAQQVAGALMLGFEEASLQHHADEESDLFPALIESMAGSDAHCLRALTRGLTAEHRQVENDWRGLRRWLSQVANGQVTAATGADPAAFVDACQQHIARERAELLPMAARLLSDAELDRIGQAMCARRAAVQPV